jgi:hypothetical protein
VVQVHATPAYAEAIRAVAELLGKLRLDCAFVGVVGRAAWLGGEVAAGSVDVVAVMGPQQKNQVAMMGSNRGFAVDREEIEASEELDLVPLRWNGIRVHVLVASNALYGRMVKDAQTAMMGETAIRVPRAEDMALLLALSADEAGVRELAAAAHFDRRAYNEKLVTIGLPELVVAE